MLISEIGRGGLLDIDKALLLSVYWNDYKCYFSVKVLEIESLSILFWLVMRETMEVLALAQSNISTPLTRRLGRVRG